MINPKEIHFYNKLADQGLVNKITCPFDKSDIVITQVDDSFNISFKCISCNTVFKPGMSLEKDIKLSIDKFKSKI